MILAVSGLSPQREKATLKVTFVYPDYFETQDIHTEPQGRVYH